MTTETEKAQLAALDKNQRRYLSRRVCGWCGHRCDRIGCAAIYEFCTEAERIERRRKCLDQYKPRKKRMKA